MKVSMKVEIEPKLEQTFDRLRDTPKHFGAALYVEAVPVMDAAVQRAPSDVGGLVDSAYVTEPSGGGVPKFELGFSAPWAAYQHERMDLPHSHGGEPKFLERALDAGGGGLLERAAARVAGWVERGQSGEVSPGRYPAAPPHIGHERHSTRQTSRREQLRRVLRRK